MTNLIGLDVGVGSIKLVSFTGNPGKLVLNSIGEAKTPRVAWTKEDKSGKAVKEVAEAIKKLVRDLKLGGSIQAVTCLPEDEVVSRLIRLPPLKENEVRDALKFEAETFVPYPLDQVSIDYEVVEEDEAGRLTVYAIAAKNDLIQTHVKLFKSAGIDLAALESPAVAMRRAVVTAVSETAAILLVDLGEKYSDIVGLNAGKIYFTRAMSVGGESLTRAISINLGLDMASAEEYKKAYGLKELQLEGKIKNAIQPVFASMAEEIRRAMSTFREDQGKAADLLVLSGGGANLPGLAEELTKVVGIEVQLLQPFVKADTSKLVVPMDLTAEGCRFALAAGLAMRGLV